MPNDLFTCRICSSSQASVSVPHTMTEHITCPSCGTYSITSTASAVWEASGVQEKQKAYASSWISEHPKVQITGDDIALLKEVEPPNVGERADKLLLALNKRFSRTGQSFSIGTLPNDYQFLAASWSIDFNELNYLIQIYLRDGLEYLSPTSIRSEVVISAKGYQHIEELSKSKINSNIGFCAMWFDESVKSVWTEAIEPAITNAGYVAKRIDTHQHNNRIDDEIIAMIRKSKFVVADFTGQRGGVYFEAGLALGLGLQVVWTCKHEDLGKVHFDNRQYSFVTWEEGKLDEFKVRLQNRIEATIGVGNNA